MSTATLELFFSNVLSYQDEMKPVMQGEDYAKQNQAACQKIRLPLTDMPANCSGKKVRSCRLRICTGRPEGHHFVYGDKCKLAALQARGVNLEAAEITSPSPSSFNHLSHPHAKTYLAELGSSQKY